MYETTLNIHVGNIYCQHYKCDTPVLLNYLDTRLKCRIMSFRLNRNY